jgi:type IV pilus assembly protein PilQ
MDRVAIMIPEILAVLRGMPRAVLVTLAVWLLPSAVALAQGPSMTDIGFNALPGGKFEIRMKFDGTPPAPQGYTIDKPARIALDLPGVSSKLAQKKHTLAFDNAQSVVVVESGGRTRVIVNLVEVAPYQASINGDELVVAVGSGGVQEYLKTTDTSAMSSSTPAPVSGHGITDFNFRRGESGEGRIELSLSDPGADVDVRLEGNTINVGFFETGVPDELRRRYDVVDFATPVQSVDVNQSGNQARIAIKVTGEYDYMAYQADNTYVVAVKPLTKQEVERKMLATLLCRPGGSSFGPRRRRRRLPLIHRIAPVILSFPLSIIYYTKFLPFPPSFFWMCGCVCVCFGIIGALA